MSRLSISDLAHQMRLRPSAIRYYEKLGVLPSPERVSGQRRYDRTVLYRLAVIQQAREAGFALDEIRALFFGFQQGTRADARIVPELSANQKLVPQSGINSGLPVNVRHEHTNLAREEDA